MPKLQIKGLLEILLDFFEITIVGVTVFLLVYLFVGQLLEVSGDSMIPTFVDKEQIIAEKISIHIKPLKRGEIVIFRHPKVQNRLLIKRVVGLPGERFKISMGNIYINGQIINEPYLSNGMQSAGESYVEDNVEYKIGEGEYALLGDNREESSDSREFGFIKENMIVGRALLVYFPLSHFRVIER